MEQLQAVQVVKRCGMRVFHQPETGVLLAETKDEICELRYDKLILATGARERFLDSVRPPSFPLAWKAWRWR